MAKRETIEVFNTLIRVQRCPNEKILDYIEIIDLDKFIPFRMKLGMHELLALKEILNKFEHKGAFLWEKEE